MNKIITIINSEIEALLNENDYRGEHSAPTEDSSPMHDLSNTYPDDIYSGDASRLYAHYDDNRDNYAIHIIQSARNKPNKPIKVYRAVPDLNFDLKQKLKPLLEIYNYYLKWNRFPLKNQIIYDLRDKYSIDNYSYDEQQKLMLDDLNNQIDVLKNQEQKNLGINNGDWVTITREYAKEHGETNLGNKFRIIGKTIPARHLVTDGNDIHEWGYYVS